MACRGVHFAITEAEAQELLTARDDEALLDLIQSDIEERWDENWLYETDKAWDSIHRCLTDGTLDPNGGDYPLKLAILSGRQLYDGSEYIISLVSPQESRDVSGALAQIDRASLKRGYDRISQTDYGVKKSEADWEYTWAYFAGLRQFFAKAAAAGRFVIFTVDQ